MKRQDYSTDDNSRMSRLHQKGEKPISSSYQIPPKPPVNHSPISRYSDEENNRDQELFIKHGEDIQEHNNMQKKKKRHKIEKVIGLITCIATVIGGFFTYLGYRKSNMATPKSSNTRIEKVYDNNKTTPSKNDSNKKDNNSNDKTKDNSSNSSNNNKEAIAKAKAQQKAQDEQKEAKQQQQIQDAIQESKQASANTSNTVKDKLNDLEQQAQNGTLSDKAKDEFSNIKDHLKGYEQSNTPAQNSANNSSQNNQ